MLQAIKHFDRKNDFVKGFDNKFSIEQSYEQRVTLRFYSDCLSKESVAESCIDEVVETSQSSQEFDYALEIVRRGYAKIHDTKTATSQGNFARICEWKLI